MTELLPPPSLTDIAVDLPPPAEYLQANLEVYNHNELQNLAELEPQQMDVGVTAVNAEVEVVIEEKDGLDTIVDDKNSEKIAKNTEVIDEFLDLELFNNIKTTHDALVEGFGGQLLEKSHHARNGVSNISERIQHFERLISGYTAEELSGDFGSGPKKLLAEIADDIELLQRRTESIGLTEHEHPLVVESIDVISTGLNTALPKLEESAEPENEWLFNFAHIGHQFASTLDRSRSSARYISDISPSLTQNMMNVIHETMQLMNYGSDNPNIKIAIRQNIEAMINIMEPMRRELSEMVNESEHVQMLGHNFMKLVEEKKQ